MSKVFTERTAHWASHICKWVKSLKFMCRIGVRDFATSLITMNSLSNVLQSLLYWASETFTILYSLAVKDSQLAPDEIVYWAWLGTFSKQASKEMWCQTNRKFGLDALTVTTINIFGDSNRGFCEHELCTLALHYDMAAPKQWNTCPLCQEKQKEYQLYGLTQWP